MTRISRGENMGKLYVIIAISAVASGIFVALPGFLENISHFTHWLTIVISSHHIAGEVAHAIHPKEHV